MDNCDITYCSSQGAFEPANLYLPSLILSISLLHSHPPTPHHRSESIASSTPAMAANGGISASPQQQLNGLLAKDADKQRVAVHTFDPDATPEQKAAAAGKGRDQLKSIVDKGDAPGGKGESVFTELQKRTRRVPTLGSAAHQ